MKTRKQIIRTFGMIYLGATLVFVAVGYFTTHPVPVPVYIIIGVCAYLVFLSLVLIFVGIGPQSDERVARMHGRWWMVSMKGGAPLGFQHTPVDVELHDTETYQFTEITHVDTLNQLNESGKTFVQIAPGKDGPNAAGKL